MSHMQHNSTETHIIAQTFSAHACLYAHNKEAMNHADVAYTAFLKWPSPGKCRAQWYTTLDDEERLGQGTSGWFPFLSHMIDETRREGYSISWIVGSVKRVQVAPDNGPVTMTVNFNGFPHPRQHPPLHGGIHTSKQDIVSSPSFTDAIATAESAMSTLSGWFFIWTSPESIEHMRMYVNATSSIKTHTTTTREWKGGRLCITNTPHIA